MKIRCRNPKHTDDIPSMEVYADGGYCFSCGWLDRDINDPKAEYREPEDISEKLAYIETLPKRQIRGLFLPVDDSGIYIVWPGGKYYKVRLHEGKLRYLSPSGHRVPLYKLGSNPNEIVIVEGEFNALSLYNSGVTQATIISPGSVAELLKHLTTYLTFEKITIIVDKDIAGIINGLKLKEELLKRGKRPRLVATERDINEILETEGNVGIKAWWEREVEV